MYTYTLYTTFSRRIEESSASIKSLKQSLYITTDMKLFVNHCASTFHKMYIRFHRSRAQGVTTIELWDNDSYTPAKQLISPDTINAA